MRGSLNSPEIAAPTTSRSTSLMRRMRGPGMLLQGLLDLFRLEELEHVVILDVGVPLEDDAALLALLDFLDVVFETAQGAELAGPDHRALADQADAGSAYGFALGDDAAGDAADLGGFEGLFDQRLADRLLDRNRVEQALHRVAQVFGDFVDDRVGADVDALTPRRPFRVEQRPHVEADDDRVGGRGEHHVGLVDAARLRMDDVDRNPFLWHFRELVLERLQGAGDVGLEDDVELLDLALLGPGEDLVEADLASLTAGQRLGFESVSALPRHLAGLAVALDRLHELAGVGDAVEAEHLDRHSRDRLGDRFAGEVLHRPHSAPLRPGDQRIADVEGSALDQDGDDGAAAGIKLGLDHVTGGIRVRIRRQLLQLGDQEDHVEQVVETLLGLRRDLAEDGVAAPLLGGDLHLGELAADLFRIGALFVDLVDGDQHRHVGGTGVVDRLS